MKKIELSNDFFPESPAAEAASRGTDRKENEAVEEFLSSPSPVTEKPRQPRSQGMPLRGSSERRSTWASLATFPMAFTLTMCSVALVLFRATLPGRK